MQNYLRKIISHITIPFFIYSKLNILCYHSISNDETIVDIAPEEFSKQIEYLADKYDFISLAEAFEYIKKNEVPNTPSVAITFDDGYKDLLTGALPILKKYDIPATIFCVSEPSKINRKELENNKKLLSLQDIRRLSRQGWDIGCHTSNHSDLVKLSKARLIREIAESKKTLTRTIGSTVDFFAYPKGHYNSAVIAVCKLAKFKAAFTVDNKLFNPGCDPYRIPRISIDRTHSLWKFKLMFCRPIQFYLKLKKSKISKYGI